MPFASCVELHPHSIVQIVPLELQFAHVLEHSQNPHGVSSHCPSYQHSSVTSQASPRLQTWERQDQFHSNAKVKQSDEATESLMKDRKAAFNLIDFCPEYSYKNHSRFSLSRRSFLEGKCLVSYVAGLSSLSVAICAWTCMAWSWTPHPHTKPCSGNLDIFPYIISSSDSCKQTSWDISWIRDGKREIQLRRPRNCNWLHQSRSLMNKIHKQIWFHNSVFCTQSNLHTRELLIFCKIRHKEIVTVSYRALNVSVTAGGKGPKTPSQGPPLGKIFMLPWMWGPSKSNMHQVAEHDDNPWMECEYIKRFGHDSLQEPFRLSAGKQALMVTKSCHPCVWHRTQDVFKKKKIISATDFFPS